jgi:hypothetical protein
MTPDTVLDLRLARGEAASQWRTDNADNPDRVSLWRWYRIGTLWAARYAPVEDRVTIRAGLDDAELTTPWHLPPGPVPMRP